MGDPAREITSDPLAIEGLEDLLEQGGPQDAPAAKQGRTEDRIIEIEGGPEDLPDQLEASAEEAATLLGISVRAVLKRLNKGTLKGRKISTKFGEKWLVDRDTLPRTIHVAIDNLDGPVAEQGRTESKTGGKEGGSEDGPEHKDSANQFVFTQSLSNQADLIATVLKQAQIIEQLTSDVRLKDEQMKLLTDSQHKAGRWQLFWSWFTGR